MSDRPRSDDELDAWIASTVPRALAYALTLVRSRPEAEDIVHDCYGRLLARAANYDLPRDGSKLLFKAITNACINWTQRRPPTVSLEETELHGGAQQQWLADQRVVGPAEQAIQRELDDAIRNALGKLPLAQRAVVELRSMGHSLIEIAEMLDISHDNARTRLHRARERLAVLLRPFLGEHVK
jgi:RNA polymerase sigma factor (sigma-70 family)